KFSLIKLIFKFTFPSDGTGQFFYLYIRASSSGPELSTNMSPVLIALSSASTLVNLQRILSNVAKRCSLNQSTR
ncbi:unnamed protein product, partial [Rotaria sp. Silwood1]